MKITAPLIWNYEYEIAPGWVAADTMVDFQVNVHGERDRDGTITLTGDPDELLIKATDGHRVAWVEPDSHLYCMIMDWLEGRENLQLRALEDDGEPVHEPSMRAEDRRVA